VLKDLNRILSLSLVLDFCFNELCGAGVENDL
jgi:hypothetical protein